MKRKEALEQEIQALRQTLAPLSEAVKAPDTLSARPVIRQANEKRESKRKTGNAGFVRKRALALASSAAIIALAALTANFAVRPAPFPVPAGAGDSLSSAAAETNEAQTPSAGAVSGGGATSAAASSRAVTNPGPITAGSYEALYEALLKIKNSQGTRYGAANGAAQSMQAKAPTAEQKGAAVNGTAGASGDEYGKTNNQVEGVEEADILQNDGKYLYYINKAPNNNVRSLQILSADGKGNMAKLSETPLAYENGYPQEMLLYKNRLAVIFTQGYNTCLIAEPGTDYAGKLRDGSAAQTRPVTAVFVYDVTDRAKPVLARTYKQDGDYVSARLVGEDFYLVSRMYAYNLDLLTRENVEDFLPRVEDTKNARAKIGPERISVLPEAQNASFVVVSGMKITGSAPASAQSILGGGGTVYATSERLYLADLVYSSKNSYTAESVFYSFRLKNATVSFHKKGSVPGAILNQFSMDEYGGCFRVATTTDGTNRANNLYVLDDSLKIVGSLLGMAPGETIQSVRFMGERAYLVTFRQTDPLFVLDLKDPKAPKLLGELKIPGFSSYLHPVSNRLLLGVGRDGNNTRAYGVKLSLFDVSDPLRPKEIQKVSVGNEGSYLASESHKAVNYIGSRSLVCVPVMHTPNYKGNTDGTAANNQANGQRYYSAASELMVYHVSEKEGFTLKARVTGDIPVSADAAAYYMDHPGTLIDRSTYIGAALYAFSPRSVIAVDMNSFKKLSGLTLTELKYENIRLNLTVHEGSAPPVIAHTPLK